MDEVYQINGEDSMAYVGALPWHGLGQNIKDGESIDVWAKTAHMDWTAERAPVVYKAGDQHWEHPTQDVLYRSDNFNPLGIVSGSYKIVQPIEVLEFYRDLTERHGFKMETAGSLRGGALVWAMARVPMELRLWGQDKVLSYLLLGTSYDKTMSTTAMFTSVRVVCANTLGSAYSRNAKGGVTVPHLATFDADQVKFDLGALGDTWHRFEESIEKMAETKLPKEDAVLYFMNLFHNPKNKEDYSDVPKNTISNMLNLFENGPGSNLKSANGTMWGAINAVTRYVDHEKGARTDENRLNSAWFGDGALLKRKAWVHADGYMEALAA